MSTYEEMIPLFCHFITKRTEAFWNRHNNTPVTLNDGRQAWSDDPVIAVYKFTNCYRVLDRVTQHSIVNIVNGPTFPKREKINRMLVFRAYTKIATYEALNKANIFGDRLNKDTWAEAVSKVNVPFGDAYSHCTAKITIPGETKATRLARVISGFDIDRIMNMQSMKECYNYLIMQETFGPFCAFQYTQDLNYIMNWPDVLEFVIPSVGSYRGLHRLFGKLMNEKNGSAAILKLYNDLPTECRKYGEKFQAVPDLRMTPGDVQNMLCEFDKYCRVAAPRPDIPNKRPKKKFTLKISEDNGSYAVPLASNLMRRPGDRW